MHSVYVVTDGRGRFLATFSEPRLALDSIKLSYSKLSNEVKAENHGAIQKVTVILLDRGEDQILWITPSPILDYVEHL